MLLILLIIDVCPVCVRVLKHFGLFLDPYDQSRQR